LLRDFPSDDEHSAHPRERRQHEVEEQLERYKREKGLPSKTKEECITAHLYGGRKTAVSILLFGCWQNENEHPCNVGTI